MGKKLSLLFTALFISLIVLEQITRCAIFGSACFSYTCMKSYVPFGMAGVIRRTKDLEILYELKPNLNTHFYLKKFVTNSQGLLDKEYTIKKPENIYRVAVMGGSWTMPSGVYIDNAFHSILERRLNSESNNKKYEFINFAVAGYLDPQKVALLKKKALLYEPDLILFSVRSQVNSFPARKRRKTYKEKGLANGFFWFHSLTPLKNVYMKTKDIVNYYYVNGVRRIYPEFRRQNNSKGLNPPSEFYTFNLTNELIDISKEYDIPIVMIFFSDELFLLHEKTGVPMRDLFLTNRTDEVHGDVSHNFDFENVKLYFVDDDELAVHTDPTYWINITDRHPNARYHALVADVIYRKLKEYKLI